MSKVLIIAEAGVNHEKDMAQAEHLIDIAVDAGADIFKTQTFLAGEVVTAACPPAEYQVNNVGAKDQFTMLTALELPREWHAPLKAHCESKGIEFFSTAFGQGSFEFLLGLGMKRVKIPSGEISNLPFVVSQSRPGLPVILSTGMAAMDEITDALGAVICGYRGDTDISIETIRAAWADKNARKILDGRVTVLHCTTDYPVKWDEVNLRAQQTMQTELGLPIGYSDHTPGIVASLAAVALGATVIEKHYTITRAFDGAPGHPSPDHKASLEPAELKALVEGIRLVEQNPTLETVRAVCLAMEQKYNITSNVEELDRLLGSSEKKPTAGAQAVAKVAKRSIVANKNIVAGDVFTIDNITLKRPTGGLSAEFFFDLIGQQATQNYAADDFIAKSEVRSLRAA